MERKLPQNIVTSVGYVGSHSVHLLADYDINAGVSGFGRRPAVCRTTRFGRTIATKMWDGYLSSNYHSLQMAVNRSFAKGLMVKGAYTYSKAIDYTDDDGWASVGWNWASGVPAQPRRRRLRPHAILQIGWLYEMPFGKGKMMAKSGVAAAVLGGWQVNGIMSAYTGTPFTVSGSGSSLNAPNNTQTANQVKSVSQPVWATSGRANSTTTRRRSPADRQHASAPADAISSATRAS